MDPRITRRAALGSIGAAGMFPAFAPAISGSGPRRNQPALEVALRIGQPQSGVAGRRHALIHGGTVAGTLMQGSVQSGRLEWLVDPASGAVEAAASMLVLRADGVLVELRDRTVHAAAPVQAGLPGVCTAPRLFDAHGASLPHALLAGRLDASGLARGVVTLRAFEQR
jgi:hypothetical protein